MSGSGPDKALLRDAMAEIDRLLDKSRAERAVLLNTLAHSQPQLHALVMELLEQEDPVNRGFMEAAGGTSTELRADSKLGPYRIVRLLGEGGMGEVWLASRDDGLYEGQVAIKTLHPYFAGGALRERFLREARVLGKLAHTNIARLLDAGIQDGVVYLVLEYVVGQPIDVACDERKLDVATRLGIFLRLCAAVAHAHSSLVVHRDIKPGNVLLTADGVTKLLDFGIANFYEPDRDAPPSDITRLTGRIFTPEYAAPEQILGKDVMAAADVYSLGVLLFVLLTGQLPYKPSGGGRTQWEHAVLHEEPRRLVQALEQSGTEAVASLRSTPATRLRRELDGDLENIVHKALRKRPEERYTSVDAFADDIKRYLQGEPVLARADSAWYRLGKFAQRNRLAVGAALAVVVSLGAGLAVSLWQLQVARTERKRAEESKEFIASIFRSADPFYTGKESMTAADMLGLARQRIDRELVAQPENAVELLTLVGESQLNLHQPDAARSSLEKAIALAEHLEPPDVILLAEARARLAVVASEAGDWEQVRALAAQALPDLRQHQPRTGRLLAEMLISMGYAAADEGNPETAVGFAQEAVSAMNTAMGTAHSESILCRSHLGHFLMTAGKLEQARLVAEQVLRDARVLASSGDGRAVLVSAEGRYGSVLNRMDDPRAAIPHFSAALDLAAQIYGPKNPSRYTWLNELGRAQGRLGDLKGMLVTRQREYEAQDGGILKARLLTNYARAMLLARRLPDSLDLLPRAIELEHQLDTGKGSWVILAQSDYGSALALSGRFEQADRLLQGTLPLARESAKDDSLESTLNAIGLMRQLQSRWAESEQAFREALAAADGASPNQKHRAEALQGIGVARLELGRAADAESWLRQADESIRKTFLGMTPLRADIRLNLGRALLAQQKIAAATEAFAVANDYWLDYDANSHSAGEAAYWLAQGHLAANARSEARVALLRSVEILKTSPLPKHSRMREDATRLVAKL